MTAKQHTLVACHWLDDSIWARLRAEHPEIRLIDGRDRAGLEAALPEATIVYGAPPTDLLRRAQRLEWLQLASAGVAWDLCDALKGSGVQLTNLAGLYGPTIAEHALALMLILARRLHTAQRQQAARLWHRDLADHMVDLARKTVAIVGLGNIGQNIARLCRAFGMRVVGCRRSVRTTPNVDQVYPVQDLRGLLAEADFVVVAAPHTRETDGLLDAQAFAAMKKGAIYVNISRGKIAVEGALFQALQSGPLASAGLDVFAVEPLPPEHPFWTMENVLISPHYSGETVNRSPQPGQLLLRNLHAFLAGDPIGHLVDVNRGY